LIETVVGGRLAVGLLEKPLRVGVVDVFVRLAEIEAADHPDAARVRFAKNLAERIAAFRDVGADIVVPHLARIKRRDAAHGHQQHIGVEVRDLSGEPRRVERRIRLP
jgi:hypothetical protein